MGSNKVYAQLSGLTSLANLSPADQGTITQTVITQLNIASLGGSASLLESGNAVYVAVTCPASLPPAYIVTQFTALKPNVLAYLRSIRGLTAIGDVTQVSPAETTGGGSTTGTSSGSGSTTGTSSGSGSTTGTSSGSGSTTGTTSGSGSTTGTTSGGGSQPTGNGSITVQLKGLSSLNQLNDDQQQKITNTVTTRLNIGSLGGFCTLTEDADHRVMLVIHCPSQIPPSNMATRYNNSKDDLLLHINYPTAIPNLTGLGDADAGSAVHGGVGGPDNAGSGSGSTGSTTGSGGGPQTGSTPGSGNVSVMLQGLSSLDQLTNQQRQQITDTVTTRLNIGSLGGFCTLTEDADHRVMLVIHCPSQIPPSNMATRYNNSKDDLLLHINYPTAIPNLTGLGNANTGASTGPQLPHGPKFRFQLEGIWSLRNLDEDTQNGIRNKTATALSVPSDRVGLSSSEGAVFVQVVAPKNESIQQTAKRYTQSIDVLSSQLQQLVPSIKVLSPPQATTSDLNLHQEKPKITLPLQGITSVSQFPNGVESAQNAVAQSLGLPPSNAEIKEMNGSVVVVFTPTEAISASRITQLIPGASIPYIIQNMTSGLVITSGTPQRSVTSKNVTVHVKQLNAKNEYDLRVDTASTLGSFKSQLASNTGILPADQQLALQGSQIISESDDTTLAEIGIVSNGLMVAVFSTKYEPPVWGTFTPPGDYKVVGYYAAWGVYMRQFFLSGVDVSRLTHLNYAFANIRNGEVVIGDEWADPKNFNLLKHMKEKNPHLKTLLSIGGWTWSTEFSDVALTANSRAKFAHSAAKLMQDNHFDGIDVDWEFPVEGGSEQMKHRQRPEDRVNLTLLMQAIRSEIGNDKLLTMAVTPNPHYYQHYEVSKLAGICDWINLMAYDYNGPWPGCNATNFNAPLFRTDNDPADTKFNIHSSVQALLDQGLPRHKLVLGLSFYGRGFSSVDPGPNGDGLYQPYSGRPYGTWPDEHDQGSGVYDFYDLRDNYIGHGDWQEHYSTEAEAAWLYSPSKHTFIGFDNPTTIWAKCSYIVSRGLGGAMIWDVSSDRGNQLLYCTNEALKPDGLTISGGKDAIPRTASGASWDDESVVSGKITSIRFRFDLTRIYGMQIVYGNHSTNWHGSSTAGWPVNIEIPSSLGIGQVVVYLSSGSSKVIEGVGLVYTNGTSTVVGTLHSRNQDTHSLRAPYGAILRHFKGKADATGITQINCSFKTLPGEDFTRSTQEEEKLQHMVRDTVGQGMKRMKDLYLARGRIDVQPQRFRAPRSTTAVVEHDTAEDDNQLQPSGRIDVQPRLFRAARSTTAEVVKRDTEEDDGELQSYGMQTTVTAGNADWLIGAGPNIQLPSDGSGYVLEYAVRSYAGFTGAYVGDKDDPKIKVSWTAPVVDYTTSAGVVVRNGNVEVTGSFLGQGGTFSAGESGIGFQGTLGNVTIDTAIGRDGLKFYATTANALFGGGFEIGRNKFAISISVFGFSVHLDFGALLRGEIDWKQFGLDLLKSMAQTALSFLRTIVRSLLSLLPFGFLWVPMIGI